MSSPHSRARLDSTSGRLMSRLSRKCAARSRSWKRANDASPCRSAHLAAVRAGPLGGGALTALARLRRTAASRLLVRDQRKGPPVDAHPLVILLADVLEPHRGVIAPGSEIVREDVQADRRRHSSPNTVGWATSVLSAWRALSTIRRRSAFSSSADSSVLPSG